jgi:hypothetical protein
VTRDRAGPPSAGGKRWPGCRYPPQGMHVLPRGCLRVWHCLAMIVSCLPSQDTCGTSEGISSRVSGPGGATVNWTMAVPVDATARTPRPAWGDIEDISAVSPGTKRNKGTQNDKQLTAVQPVQLVIAGCDRGYFRTVEYCRPYPLCELHGRQRQDHSSIHSWRQCLAILENSAWGKN